jgi:nucleotide-binding universal stress UspA family protein
MVQHERTVVVGVDGSPEALEAARYAAAEAETRGATLTLAHAVDLPPLVVPYPAPVLKTRRDRGSQVLHEMQLQLPASTASRGVHSVLEMTSPVALLCELSKNADLLVVGHRGASLFEKLLGGSVSGPVARQAHCPVLIVPRGWTAWSAGEQPVVLALDGESSARSALDLAFTSAERLHVDLVVLHAAEPSPLQWMVDEDKANIAVILAGAEQDHPDVVVRTARVESEPGRAIVDAAGAASLLVVGRPHGTQHFGSWTQSVANSVLKQVHCPVMVAVDPVDPAIDQPTWFEEPEAVR